MVTRDARQDTANWRSTRGIRTGNALIVRRRPAVAIGPTGVPRQANRRFSADLMPRRGAEFEDLQPVAEQIDVVDGLRALIAAVDDARSERIGAVLFANRDIFRPQRDPHLFARPERMQQRRVGAPPAAEIDHAEFAVTLDQRAGKLVG